MAQDEPAYDIGGTMCETTMINDETQVQIEEMLTIDINQEEEIISSDLPTENDIEVINEKETVDNKEFENRNESEAQMELINKQFDHLDERMDQLVHLFEDKISRTEYEEKIVDRMHAELQKHKEGMYAQMIRPILIDIIEVRDSIRRVSLAHSNDVEKEGMIPIKIFSDYMYDLQDILEKNEIKIYEHQHGDLFDPAKQRAIKKIETDNLELHGKIESVLSAGYLFQEKVIIPEKVSVYVTNKND